jgi:hypothetical protein
MSKIKLPNLFKIFKRREQDPLEKELRKYPKRDRARLRELWKQWEGGKFLTIEKK